MPLRPSQVETLRFVAASDAVRVRDVGRWFEVGRDAARSRLAGLYVRNLLAFRLDGYGAKVYRLTQLGHEALEGKQ
jgi:predicted DNA-binding transcriptional regulator